MLTKTSPSASFCSAADEVFDSGGEEGGGAVVIVGDLLITHISLSRVLSMGINERVCRSASAGSRSAIFGQFHSLQHLLNTSTARLSELSPTNPV